MRGGCMATEAPPDGAQHGLPTGRFAGREAFRQQLRDALACAARLGWKELVLSDADFGDWPLHEGEVAESLRQWARPGRRFVMLARSYDAVQRDKHRFVAWRQTWSHLIDCRLCRRIDAADFPSLLWSPAWAMRRLDARHCSGVATDEARQRVQWRELLDELLADSSPGFPATVLGL